MVVETDPTGGGTTADEDEGEETVRRRETTSTTDRTVIERAKALADREEVVRQRDTDRRAASDTRAVEKAMKLAAQEDQDRASAAAGQVARMDQTLLRSRSPPTSTRTRTRSRTRPTTTSRARRRDGARDEQDRGGWLRQAERWWREGAREFADAPADGGGTADLFFRSISFGGARNPYGTGTGDQIARGFVQGSAELPADILALPRTVMAAGPVAARLGEKYIDLHREHVRALTTMDPERISDVARRDRERARYVVDAGAATARYFQEHPRELGRLGGAVAIGGGASIAGGIALGRGLRLARGLYRTRGARYVAPEEFTNPATLRVAEGRATGAEAARYRFPPFDPEELRTFGPAGAFRRQSQRYAPDAIVEELGDDAGAIAKRAMDVEPEGPRPGTYQTQAGGYEAPGAFVAPELSPNFLRIGGRQGRISLLPGLPDLGGRPTGIVTRVPVREPPASVRSLEEFADYLEAQSGRATAYTKPRGEVAAGEAEAVVPPGAVFEGTGGRYFTTVAGQRVPIRTYRAAGIDVDVDTGDVARAADRVDDVVRGDRYTIEQLSRLSRPVRAPVDRPLPYVPVYGGRASGGSTASAAGGSYAVTGDLEGILSSYRESVRDRIGGGGSSGQGREARDRTYYDPPPVIRYPVPGGRERRPPPTGSSSYFMPPTDPVTPGSPLGPGSPSRPFDPGSPVSTPATRWWRGDDDEEPRRSEEVPWSLARRQWKTGFLSAQEAIERFLK